MVDLQPGTALRCTLCRCAATTEKFGFRVCAYHFEHGEDDPPCSTCNHPALDHDLANDPDPALELTRNAAFPQLHRDAPDVPAGLQPKPGVEYGCGEASCASCYEPAETGGRA